MASRLTVAERRRAMVLAYANGGLWAVGNGLTSTTLVTYLALELGAAGLAVSLIVATPALIGVLRLAAPAMIERLGDRRRFCLVAFLTSNVLLLALPLLSAPGVFASTAGSLAALVVLWSTYHLGEYFGTIALWSWLADIAPLRVRGRFIGRRERWLTLGRILGMTASGLFAFAWTESFARDLRWIGYAIPAAAGGLMMIVSLIPLALMPSLPIAERFQTAPPWQSLAAPFRDGRFLRLLAFGCWFSFFNGLTQTPLVIYPVRVLELHLFWMLALAAMMRLGQSGVSPWVGRWADRYGNRPVMIVSQILVSAGPLFYLAATPAAPEWLAGAWLLWIAYAGLNVTLPALMLKLSPGGNSSPFIAAYFAVTGLCFGLSTIAGGALFDLLADMQLHVTWGPLEFDHFQYLFWCGWVTRLMGVGLLFTIDEPGAWSLRRFWAGKEKGDAPGSPPIRLA